MVIWKNVIKRVIRSLFIILLPVFFAILIGLVIGFYKELILFTGQVYLTLAMLEVALRQAKLSMLQYEPAFGLEFREDLQTGGFYITNDGYTARNVSIYINDKHVKTFGTFASGQEERLTANDLLSILFLPPQHEKNLVVRVEYENIFGDSGWISFIYSSKLDAFIVVGKSFDMPGLLLNSIEELRRIYRLLKYG
ncbi:hypothetical protein DRP04_09135 [Archaeoglobales archaeon]|nr:MAG: hypothetical protein DRP04_09135 [Archaeoglobales archaeon]